MSDLGRLERVPLRHTWHSEAQDFTPWLAGEDNLALLGEVLGIDLELEAVEQNVGPFRADILCKDTLSDRWVLIENQLERTDHTHLGQLITYAAGLDAVTIVWIAARVTDEHRAALDWLNEITDSDVRFFALEVELWRIGGSPAAPKFNVVSKPNDWSRATEKAKRVVADGAVTPTRLAQKDFWDEVVLLAGAATKRLRMPTPAGRSWIPFRFGRSGMQLGLTMNTRENWIRVEAYLRGDKAAGNYFLLQHQRDGIERDMGYTLDWQELPNRQASRVCITRKVDDLMDRTTWPAQHKWLIEKLRDFERVLCPVMLDIDPESAEMIS